MGEKIDRVIGHEEVKLRLKSRLEKDPSGVFLFCGPASVGKRTTAFELSEMVLCKTKSEKCKCVSCKRFKIGHPDFLCVGRNSKIKVADVDSIIDFCSTTPFLSDSKITVLDNAHNMTVEAANRLLKLLEEPPLNYSFFLITSNPEAIIPTVTSRCIKYEFGSLTREDLTVIIKKKLGFPPKKAEVLSGLSVGTSLDIFSKAGEFLRYRDMAIELISGMGSKFLEDSIDYIDKIEKDDLPLFSDMVILVLTDLILLQLHYL